MYMLGRIGHSLTEGLLNIIIKQLLKKKDKACLYLNQKKINI